MKAAEVGCSEGRALEKETERDRDSQSALQSEETYNEETAKAAAGLEGLAVSVFVVSLLE